MEDIFEILVRNAINGRLDIYAEKDEDYRELDSRLDEAQKAYIGLGLPEEQKQVINQMTEAGTALLSQYAVLAYKLAVKDTVSLLREMEVIGSDTAASSHVDM